MSNADLLRERVERWVRERTLVPEYYTPEFVWDMSTFRGWPERREYEGTAGMEQFLREWLEAWEDWTFEVEDAVEGDEGKIVLVAVQTGINRAAGVPVEMRLGQVWTLNEEGRAVRMEMYADPAEALAAAGAA
jgi:ketosteroid isomerase-like protein